jgi:hypothetical protein
MPTAPDSRLANFKDKVKHITRPNEGELFQYPCCVFRIATERLIDGPPSAQRQLTGRPEPALQKADPDEKMPLVRAGDLELLLASREN